MSFLLNKLPKIKRNSKIRVGRGIGSSKGKTSGRGVKGQKARTGHHSVKGFEGGQTPIHMRLPKRGFTNIHRKKLEIVNIENINNLLKNNKIKSGSTINKEILHQVGLIKNQKSTVKLIMGKKDINIDLKVIVDKYSKKANRFA